MEPKNDVFFEEEVSYYGGPQETAWGYNSRRSHVGTSPHPRQSPSSRRPSTKSHVTTARTNHAQSDDMMQDVRTFAREILPSVREDVQKRFDEESRIASRLRGK